MDAIGKPKVIESMMMIETLVSKFLLPINLTDDIPVMAIYK